MRADHGARGWMRGGEIQPGSGPVGWKSEQTGVISASVSHRATSRPDASHAAAVWGDNHGNGAISYVERSEIPSAHDVITRDTVQGSSRARTGSERVCDVFAPVEA